ncbi:hypothetical protein [Rhizobium sp. GN54]|uniref:hypothetical protein n=1 Tax=Rhizobium sp. GN54 TaxID=2898150 RepID=UPI001E3385CC|nr:hypothetical protein [Rhizobium sp. GN54]MCD2181617.1 hypothetical protein [Rhizobium sp. GN54]
MGILGRLPIFRDPPEKNARSFARGPKFHIEVVLDFTGARKRRSATSQPWHVASGAGADNGFQIRSIAADARALRAGRPVNHGDILPVPQNSVIGAQNMASGQRTEAGAMGAKDGLLAMLLTTLVSCSAGDALRSDAPETEKPEPRSVEWLRQRCPDCIDGGPRYIGPADVDPRNAGPGNATPKGAGK